VEQFYELIHRSSVFSSFIVLRVVNSLQQAFGEVRVLKAELRHPDDSLTATGHSELNAKGS